MIKKGRKPYKNQGSKNMGEEKAPNTTKKAKPKVKHFDNWMTGILNLEKYYVSYIANKEMLKEYNKKVNEYKFSFTFMITLIALSISSIVTEFVTGKPTFGSVVNILIIDMIIFALVKVSKVWKQSITFNTGVIKNQWYKRMMYVDSTPIFDTVNYVGFLINLYAMTIIAMLYSERIKGLSRTKACDAVRKTLDVDDIVTIYRNVMGEDADFVTASYFCPRVSSSLLYTLIKNPKIHITIERSKNYADIKEIDDSIISFFKYCNDTDDMECICEQKSFESDIYSYCLESSPFCTEALLKIMEINLPEFEERLKKFAAKKNSPFKGIYENYKKIVLKRKQKMEEELNNTKAQNFKSSDGQKGDQNDEQKIIEEKTDKVIADAKETNNSNT